MNDNIELDIITEAVKDFLKPIVKSVITESLAEAFEDMLKKNSKRYYTRDEACERLRIKTTTFYSLAKKGKIKLLKVEGKTLVDADELDSVVHTRRVYRCRH